MKKILAVLLVLSLAFCLFACTGNKEATYDAEKVALALATELEFGETLEKSVPEVAYSIYGISSELCEEAVLYCGSGATADEVAVFKCINETAAEEISLAASLRLDYLREGYSSYGPAEVPKIDAATLFVDGKTVIVCICENSEEVESIIKANAD